jgi:hypothetical protein
MKDSLGLFQNLKVITPTILVSPVPSMVSHQAYSSSSSSSSLGARSTMVLTSHEVQT